MRRRFHICGVEEAVGPPDEEGSKRVEEAVGPSAPPDQCAGVQLTNSNSNNFTDSKDETIGMGQHHCPACDCMPRCLDMAIAAAACLCSAPCIRCWQDARS